MKKIYRSMNEHIHPSDGLQETVFAKIERPKRCMNLRPLSAIAAVLVLVILATPVMAAYVPPIAELMYQVSPEMAARFTPIQKSYEKNGVRMEIESASIHGATAEICVSFEDVESDRITAQSMAQMYHTQILGRNMFLNGTWGETVKDSDFDEVTGKLIMVVERNFSFYSEKDQRYMTVKEIFGDKMTVRVDRLYRFVALPEVKIPVTLTDNAVMTVQVDRSKPTDRPMEVPFDGFGYGSSTIGDPWLSLEEYDLLTPGEPVREITGELAVMGIAYIDGRLHVQTRLRTEDEEKAPIYHVYFRNAEGETVGAANYNSFVINNGSERGEYEESIFDIPEEELEEYELICEVSNREVLEGPWRVTFPITESDYTGERDDGVPLVTAPDQE